MNVEQYWCPNCGGMIGMGNLQCLSCHVQFDRSVFEPSAGAPNFEHAGFEFTRANKQTETAEEELDLDFELVDAPNVWSNDDISSLSGGSCPSCGAEFFGSRGSVSTICRWCGQSYITAGQMRKGVKPDRIIPFKLNNNDAVAALKKFLKGRPLLPSGFADSNRVESVHGIYAPFWLYDAKLRGTVLYDALRYEGAGNNKIAARAISLDAYGVIAFDRIPVDASKNLDDGCMDSLEPFDYDEMVEFDKSHLAGYAAEKASASAEESKPRAENRMANTFKKRVKESAKEYASGDGYIRLKKAVHDEIEIIHGKALYGLLPVWILNTKSNGENYQFMMNGQTGRMAGKLPVDNNKAWMYGLALAAIMGALLSFAAINLSEWPLVVMILSLPVAAFAIYGYTSKNLLMAIGPGAAVFALLTGLLAWDVPLRHLAISIIWIASAASGIFAIRAEKRWMDTACEKATACDYTAPASYSCTVSESMPSNRKSSHVDDNDDDFDQDMP